MEGVTEPCFRDLVLERNAPHELGGAFTEFVRVHRQALPRGAFQRHLGARRFPQPVGLQLMGSEADILGQYTALAIEAGAPLVDLNFGCPSKRAVAGCAGSALLDYPEKMEEFVRACVQAAAGRVPVTAKIRSGVKDDLRLEELARVHCRTREEGYRDCADWRRVARAVAAVKVPVCGNGSIRSHADLERMRRETGCAYAMVGRAALGDPWIFSGRETTAADAAEFLLSYGRSLVSSRYREERGAMCRVKQLISYWTAGGLIPTRADRAARLREPEPEALWSWLEETAEPLLKGARA
jgi:tRNA-dihydrouridine synthase C